MQIFINILLSYFIGSISGSIVLGKLRGIDIRTMGSGNAGGTNAFRTVGASFALGVIFIDILKGVISVLFISQLNLSISTNHELIIIGCAIAAVLGHIYPIYYKFKGGKGAGTLIGIIAVLFPFQCILYAIIVWIIILIFTGFVGLSTMAAGITLSICAYFFNVSLHYFCFSIGMSLLIFFTHRSNIQRMFKGEENQFRKIMIFKKLFKK
tara:strand:+ start:62 stop:691 length:630 start_codon:yes stop_codon:yes gene_type:complete